MNTVAMKAMSLTASIEHLTCCLLLTFTAFAFVIAFNTSISIWLCHYKALVSRLLHKYGLQVLKLAMLMHKKTAHRRLPCTLSS